MLQKLRAQSHQVKKGIAFAISGAVSVFIFVIWLSSLPARHDGDESRKKALSPLSGVSVVFQNTVTSIKSSVSGGLPMFFDDAGRAADVSPSDLGAAPVNSSGFDMAGIVILGATDNATGTKKSTSAGL